MELLPKVKNRARTTVQRRRLSPLAREVIEERLTYLSPVKLRQIEQGMERIAREGVPGDVIECGVALGGSAVVLARAAVDGGRRFDGYDTFGMIPPPGPDDTPDVHERYATIEAGKSVGIGGDPYYGYRDDLLDHNVSTLARHGVPVGENVALHQGLFEDTLHPEAPVAFAHIDCDWYDPVKLCMERIWPHLSPGGLVVLDDYHAYGSAKQATDEFVAAHPMEVIEDREHRILRRSAD